MFGTIRFGDIVKRVRRQIGDDHGGRFSDSDVARWINSAQREIVKENNLLQKTAYIPLIGDENKYALPDDIFLLHSIAYDGLSLIGLSLREFQDLNKDGDGIVIGKPLNFCIWAGQLRVHPKPAQGQPDPPNLEVFYTRRPTSIDGSDHEVDLDLPDLYEERILEYCLAQAAEMDEDTEKYALKMQEFQQGVANTQHDIDQLQRDVYPSISVVPEDYDHIYSGVYW